MSNNLQCVMARKVPELALMKTDGNDFIPSFTLSVLMFVDHVSMFIYSQTATEQHHNSMLTAVG